MKTTEITCFLDWCQAVADYIKDAINAYKMECKLSDEQLADVLNVSVHVIYAIQNSHVYISPQAISYFEDKLSMSLCDVKSHIGSSPTLFNSSQTSGFVYKVVGCDVEGMHRLNYKEGFLDIIKAIKEEYSLEYAGCRNDIFEQNIRMVDSRMDEILSNAMLINVGYLGGLDSTSVADMCNALASQNPLGARNPKYFYETKLKCFLFASFAGMTASKEWNGRKKLTGGYIDVDREGELLYYRAISDDIFENYLFRHTYVDRPDRGVCKTLAVAEAKVAVEESRSLTDTERNKVLYKDGVSGIKNNKKGDWGYVYQEGEDFFIVINFQIRFR